MKKVVSVALFGEGDTYSRYLPSFFLAHLNLFPQHEGWVLRAHVDEIGKREGDGFLQLARAFGLVELREMGEAKFTKSMLWRLAPIFDLANDDCFSHVFCRDLDSLPTPRDRQCCDEFIAASVATNMNTHVIHDNRMHERMMGGLCGFFAPGLRHATGWRVLDNVYRFAGEVDWAKKGIDQMVLNKMLVDFGGAIRLLEHCYSGWSEGLGKYSPRRPGQWPCEAWSRPTPDIGAAHFQIARGDAELVASLTERADLLAPHMGSAGYDVEAAVKFWDKFGDPEVARLVRACEEK